MIGKQQQEPQSIRQKCVPSFPRLIFRFGQLSGILFSPFCEKNIKKKRIFHFREPFDFTDISLKEKTKTLTLGNEKKNGKYLKRRTDKLKRRNKRKNIKKKGKKRREENGNEETKGKI